MTITSIDYTKNSKKLAGNYECIHNDGYIELRSNGDYGCSNPSCKNRTIKKPSYKAVVTCQYCKHYMTEADPGSIAWSKRTCILCTGIVSHCDGITRHNCEQFHHDHIL